jgi:hypothetical protein
MKAVRYASLLRAGHSYRDPVGRRSKPQARRISFVIMPAMLIISLGLVVPVADTVPRYDVRSTCRAAVALAGGTEGRTVENCMATEDTARKDLEKDWAKTPTAERTQCVGTVAVGGSPSYVELLICLEMMQDSRKHQQEERAKSRKPAGKT